MTNTNQKLVEKLLPCPFCGGNRLHVDQTIYEPTGTEKFAISCRTRGCHGVIFNLGFDLFHSQEEAIFAWNTRVNTEQKSMREIKKVIERAVHHGRQGYLNDADFKKLESTIPILNRLIGEA